MNNFWEVITSLKSNQYPNYEMHSVALDKAYHLVCSDQVLVGDKVTLCTRRYSLFLLLSAVQDVQWVVLSVTL